MIIRFDYNGKTYDYDSDRFALFEARMVKSLTGLNAGAYLRGLGEMDHEALACMVYLTLRRADEDVEWDALGFMDLMPLIQSIGDHRDDVEADEVEAPVEPAGEGVEAVPAALVAPVAVPA